MSETPAEGYLFEPEYSEDELMTSPTLSETDGRVEVSTTAFPGRTMNFDWCSCSNCSVMPSEKECLCCTEVQTLRRFLLNCNLSCFCTHEDFEAVCLNPSVLRASYAALRELRNRGHSIEIPDSLDNRTYRLLAYRNFISWTHGRLGPGVRKIIPSCVVNKIRGRYVQEDNNYTGFIEGNSPPEYEASWMLELEH